MYNMCMYILILFMLQCWLHVDTSCISVTGVLNCSDIWTFPHCYSSEPLHRFVSRKKWPTSSLSALHSAVQPKSASSEITPPLPLDVPQEYQNLYHDASCLTLCHSLYRSLFHSQFLIYPFLPSPAHSLKRMVFNNWQRNEAGPKHCLMSSVAYPPHWTDTQRSCETARERQRCPNCPNSVRLVINMDNLGFSLVEIGGGISWCLKYWWVEY